MFKKKMRINILKNIFSKNVNDLSMLNQPTYNFIICKDITYNIFIFVQWQYLFTKCTRVCKNWNKLIQNNIEIFSQNAIVTCFVKPDYLSELYIKKYKWINILKFVYHCNFNNEKYPILVDHVIFNELTKICHPCQTYVTLSCKDVLEYLYREIKLEKKHEFLSYQLTKNELIIITVILYQSALKKNSNIEFFGKKWNLSAILGNFTKYVFFLQFINYIIFFI